MNDKPTRGGACPGAGRKPIPGRIPMINICIPVREPIKMRLEFESNKRGITVAAYVREAIDEKISFEDTVNKIHKKGGEE